MVLRVVLVVFLLASFASSAEAQLPEPQWDLEVVAAGAPIQPLAEAANVPYTLTLTCDAGTIRPSMDPIKVDLTATTSVSWAVIVVTPKEHFVNATADVCAAGVEEKLEGNVSIALTKDAPANELFPITLTATPGEGAELSHMWNETSGVYLKTQARFVQAIWQAPPSSEVRIPLKVENFGNSVIRATVVLQESAESLLNVTLPEPFEVGPGETGTAELTAITPPANGYINRRDTIALHVTMAALDDTAQTEQVTLQAVIQTQGTDVVEGPAPTPLLVGLLGLALFALRRRG